MTRTLIAALAVACSMLPAHAQYDTTDPRGGDIGIFIAAVDDLNAHHQTYRIDNVRESAAVIFLAVKRVCVTPGAMLGFHAATHNHGYDGEVRFESRIAWSFPRLYRYVAGRGWFGTQQIHWLSGREAIGLGVPRCRD